MRPLYRIGQGIYGTTTTGEQCYGRILSAELNTQTNEWEYEVHTKHPHTITESNVGGKIGLFN